MPADKGQRDSMQRLDELIARLDEVQREIQGLTQDQVDAVLMPDGLPFLLSGAQEALRRNARETNTGAAPRARQRSLTESWQPRGGPGPTRKMTAAPAVGD